MKKPVKIILLTVLAAAVAGGAFWAGTRPLAVETVTAAPGLATVTFTERGSYVYGETFAVYPVVAGEVLEVPVTEGERVRAGQVLAVIDASDYRNQIVSLESGIAGYEGQIAALGQSEQQRRDALTATLAGLAGQIAALDTEIARGKWHTDSLAGQIATQEAIVRTNRRQVEYARDDLDDARDTGDDALISAARQAENTARNVLAQSQLVLEQLRTGNVPADIYEGQKAAVDAQIVAVQEQLLTNYSGGMRQYYEAQIEAASRTIAQMEEKAGKAEITAPFAGTVSLLPAADKNLVSQAEPAAVLGVSPAVEVYVPVRETDGIHVGDTVELLLEKRLGEESIAGTVTEIEDEAVARLSALGVEERRVRVLIRPSAELNIGYDTDVRFTVYTQENAVVLPKTALFADETGADAVWLLRDGALAVQRVVKGVETRDGYIVEGLAAGAAVVRDANQEALVAGKKAVNS